jgi:hypothetical protein
VIVSLLAIGTLMLLKGAKDVVMIAGTFGALMYKKGDLSFYLRGISKVLPSNIAYKIKERAQNSMLLFTQQEKEEILSWIEEQFSNQNRYNNFFIGTVLMIGLLGTFSGLLGAIGSMAGIVMSLSGSDIDIGEIMAGFSGPLSSMAVGFGSSLFGVIAAILLSIKGYLLNRSQASVIDGVENWLNANTVDSMEIEEEVLEKDEKLIKKQPKFMDIFAQKMGELHKEIETLNKNNRSLQSALEKSLGFMHMMQQTQSKTYEILSESLKKMDKSHNENFSLQNKFNLTLENSIKEQQRALHTLIDITKKGNYNQVDLNTKLEDLVYMIEKSQKDKSESEIDNKIALFQLAEAIENLHKDLVKSEKKEQKDEKERSFLQKHFGLKSAEMKG